MKQNVHSHGLLFLLLLLLLTYSTTAARLLEPTQGKDVMNEKGVIHKSPILEIEEEDSWNLMGEEKCNNGDEECLKRRMISDAHLDYIYTQKHKP